jgi:hypothetical protein
MTFEVFCECTEIYFIIFLTSLYRQYFSDVIANTRQELQESGTYTSLLQALNEERDSKIHFFDVIARSE